MDDTLRTSLAGRQPLAVIVEDDDRMARLETRILEADGWTVMCASTANELEALLTNHHPDLILLDVLIPGGNGLDILSNLKAQPETAHIPVVLATGQADPSNIETGLDAGAQDYLTKPFKPHELRARANGALRAGLAATALVASEAQYRAAFESAPVGMAQLDLAGRFIEVNTALTSVLGQRARDLVGSSIDAVSDPADRKTATAVFHSLVTGGAKRQQYEGRFRGPDGARHWMAVSVAIVNDNSGAPHHILAHFVDVTDRKAFEGQLQHLADHDALTGLLNRRGFEAELSRYMGRLTGGLLVLDLDNFKQVNDTLGHNAGDELIISVADLLRRTVRGTDSVARLGGDEFAIILADANAADAELVADKIVRAVRRGLGLMPGHAPPNITVSVGVAMFDDPDLTADAILVRADLSMYDAKESGRDGWAIYRNADHDQPLTKARLEWVDKIRTALAAGGFELFAEPILDLRTGNLNRYELLLRMRDVDGVVIAPAAFLAVAERVGLIGEIDRRVVTEAIKLLEDPALDRDIALEVNLSGLSLGDPLLLKILTDGLSRPGLDPHRLIFEVTETAAVANVAVARDFAERVGALGCRFALDDFCAGFGSFYYLKHLPFDFVKIDGEFVADCLTTPTDRLVIEAVVSIARGLGKETIAEFVGDEATLVFLRDQGVDYAQGYHIGKPQPLATLLRGPGGRKGEGGRTVRLLPPRTDVA